MRLPVGIVGFRGYCGAELVAILQRHSSVDPVLLEHRSDAGERPLPRGHAGPKRIPATPEAVRSEKLASRIPGHAARSLARPRASPARCRHLSLASRVIFDGRAEIVIRTSHFPIKRHKTTMRPPIRARAV